MTDYTNLPVPYANITEDGFDLVANAANNSRTKFLSFKKGEFMVGAEKTIVPLGAKFVVHAATEGWVRLSRGQAPRRIPRKPGERFPDRAELGDTDKTEWATFDGKPSDPWSLGNELLMTAVDTGSQTIFSTMSWSGRELVADLCSQITFERRRRGDGAKPVVEIGSAKRPSPRGPFAVPAFKIVGWVGACEVPEPAPSKLADDLTNLLQERSAVSGSSSAASPLPKPRKRAKPFLTVTDDLDDEIPY